MEVMMDCRYTNPRRGKNSNKYLPVRLAFTPAFHFIARMLLNFVLEKCMQVYKFTKSQEKDNQLIYMNNSKVFTENGKGIRHPDVY